MLKLLFLVADLASAHVDPCWQAKCGKIVRPKKLDGTILAARLVDRPAEREGHRYSILLLGSDHQWHESPVLIEMLWENLYPSARFTTLGASRLTVDGDRATWNYRVDIDGYSCAESSFWHTRQRFQAILTLGAGGVSFSKVQLR